MLGFLRSGIRRDCSLKRVRTKTLRTSSPDFMHLQKATIFLNAQIPVRPYTCLGPVPEDRSVPSQPATTPLGTRSGQVPLGPAPALVCSGIWVPSRRWAAAPPVSGPFPSVTPSALSRDPGSQAVCRGRTAPLLPPYTVRSGASLRAPPATRVGFEGSCSQPCPVCTRLQMSPRPHFWSRTRPPWAPVPRVACLPLLAAAPRPRERVPACPPSSSPAARPLRVLLRHLLGGPEMAATEEHRRSVTGLSSKRDQGEQETGKCASNVVNWR